MKKDLFALAVLGVVLVLAPLRSATFADEPSQSPEPAASAAPLPFTPPSGWAKIPTDLARPVLSWRSTLSSFAVTTTALDFPSAMFVQIIAKQTESLGTAVTSSAAPVCNAPAYRTTVKMSAAPQFFTSQIQRIDGVTYFLIYVHPDTERPDPAIVALLDSFCGQKSVDAAVMPAGWRDADGRMLGTWVGTNGGESIALLASNPATSSERTAADAATKAFAGASSTIISNTTGTLCGVPATFVTGRVVMKTGTKVDYSMEITQNETVAYTLIYSHAFNIVKNDAASASLASLCAAGAISR